MRRVVVLLSVVLCHLPRQHQVALVDAGDVRPVRTVVVGAAGKAARGEVTTTPFLAVLLPGALVVLLLLLLLVALLAAGRRLLVVLLLLLFLLFHLFVL